MRARSLNTADLVGDCDGPALSARPEREGAVALGEDRVVLADPRAGARAEARATLADDDHAGLHRLAVEELDAEALRVRVAAVPGGAKTFLVSHLAFLLSFCLERGDCALACRMRTLVLERRLDLLGRPARRFLVDVGDCHLRVAPRQLRRRFHGHLLLRRGLSPRGPADRLDLDLGELGTEAGVPAVALLGLVLADADLLAERRADHFRRHLHARRQVRLAVSAGEENVRMERLALGGGDMVHEQAIARVDAVLLSAE